MRQVRQAFSEGGLRAAAVAATHLPGRHPWPFFLAGLGFLACVVLFGYVDTKGEVREVNTRVTYIERSDPCVSLSGAASEDGASRRRIARLTRACVDFLDELGKLISPRLACAIFDAAEAPCPHRRRLREARRLGQAGRGGVVAQPAPAGQPSGPAPAGPRGSKGPGRGPKGMPDSGSPAPVDTPLPPPVLTVPAPETPGNSPATPPGQSTDPLRGVVDHTLDAVCQVTHPVTGICLK